jgi:hypothetical protein
MKKGTHYKGYFLQPSNKTISIHGIDGDGRIHGFPLTIKKNLNEAKESIKLYNLTGNLKDLFN